MNVKKLTAADVIGSVSGSPDFSVPSASYSPFYSTIGLQAGKDIGGIGELYFHYNRATRSLCGKLLDFPVPLSPEKTDVCSLRFEKGVRKAALAFYKRDAFIFESENVDKIPFLAGAEDFCRLLHVKETEAPDTFVISAYSRNPDDRDPDEFVPFSVRLTVFEGSFIHTPGSGRLLLPGKSGRLRISAEFGSPALRPEDTALDISAEAAARRCREWFDASVADMDVSVTGDVQKSIVCTAVYGLVFNTAEAQGSLSGHLSAFPSRGGYPTHFTWDTYFQNLAYEKINRAAAEDFLFQICDNIRPDGKIPQFMCSTWGRPHDAQPALLGWAAKRIFVLKETAEEKLRFANRLLPFLEKNNGWWLTCRMTDCGLIFCPGGLETGQDDSPRFDRGPAVSADMNSYLYSQLCFTSEICSFAGLNERSSHWSAEAEKLRAAMLSELYDEETGLFFDILLKDRSRIRLLTPNCFLPLWAGVYRDESRRDSAIRNFLLNEKFFFGSIPFPSVAYCEPVYSAGSWWRGPTWMPVAYLMLEVLEKYGFEKEYFEAAERLYNVLLSDREMHELFNSETGEGLGNVQQGWSCAIFIKLGEILDKRS